MLDEEYVSRIEQRLAELRKRGPVVSLKLGVDVERSARELLNRYGLPMVPYRCFMQYARSLARVFRDYRGAELDTELDLAMARWIGHGLEPELVRRFTSELRQAVFGTRPAKDGDDGKKNTG